MHTNNWRPLNARDAESYEKKKNIIYIFLAAPCGLAEFPVGESQCSGTSGTHFYQPRSSRSRPSNLQAKACVHAAPFKMATKVQKIMTQPINLIFRFLQSKQVIQIWLFDQADLRIEGKIIGFDEYMNLVLDDAHEVSVKRKSRKPLGRILLKGDNITLMQTTGR